MIEKYKDKIPEETIDFFKGKLNELGFSFTQETVKMAEDVYSIILTDSQHNGFRVCGKGTSEKYALASAYGEAVERVQCLYFNHKINWRELSEKIGKEFIYCPDEKIIKNSEIINKVPSYGEDIKKKIYFSSKRSSINSFYSSFLKGFEEKEEICIKFHHYNTNSEIYLPIEELYNLSGSNGMCSGNTESEAFVQGLSELFERWAEEYIYNNELTPPEIPINFIKNTYPRIYQMILSMKETYGYDSYLYDCSLGKGVPVVCVIFIDKNTLTYKKSFGAHPRMEIALERCFTEALQTCPLKEDQHKRCNTVFFSSILEKEWNTPKQYLKRYNAHTGAIPYKMFYVNPSWAFVPWSEEENFSNDKACKNLKNLCVDLGFNLFYKDFNCLGIPSYYIYIPGVSAAATGFDDLCDYFLYKESFLESIRKNQILDGYSKEKMMLLLEDNLISIDPLNNWVDMDTLLLALYVEFRQFDKAINLIHNVFGYSQLFRCLEKELELRKLNIAPENRDNILLKFFDKEYVNYVSNLWRKENIYLHLINDDYILPFDSNKDLNIVETKSDPINICSVFSICKNIKSLISQRI